MKAEVNASRCTGCGLCEETCPEVFRLQSKVAEVIVGEVPEGPRESCRESMRDCPVTAITVEE